MFYAYKNIKIHYEIEGKGKPVLMIHGLNCDLNLMKGCMEPVFKNKKGYERIYVDLPGMGKSEAVLEYASSDKILEILSAFVRDIARKNFLLIGESYGGYLARGILYKFYYKIDGMALICPVVKARHSERDIPNTNIKFEDDDFLNTLGEFERKSFCKFAVIADKKTYKRYKKEILSGVKRIDGNFIDSLEKNYSFSFDVDGRIRKLNFENPVLFIAGRQDVCVGYNDLWRLLENYPRATYAIIDSAGHNLQIEAPKIFNSLIENFLERAKNNK